MNLVKLQATKLIHRIIAFLYSNNVRSEEKSEKPSHYHHIKKNKICRNKFNKRSARSVHRKLQNITEKLKITRINGKISHIQGLEDNTVMAMFLVLIYRVNSNPYQNPSCQKLTR